MARSKTVIDTVVLQGIINKLEGVQTFKNRGELFVAASAGYEEQTKKKISAVMISNRFDELKLTCKTAKSTRGRPKKSTTSAPNLPPNPTKIKSMTRVEVAGPEADMDVEPDPVDEEV